MFFTKDLRSRERSELQKSSRTTLTRSLRYDLHSCTSDISGLLLRDRILQPKPIRYIASSCWSMRAGAAFRFLFQYNLGKNVPGTCASILLQSSDIFPLQDFPTRRHPDFRRWLWLHFRLRLRPICAPSDVRRLVKTVIKAFMHVDLRKLGELGSTEILIKERS